MNKQKKILIITGAAPCVMDDVNALFSGGLHMPDCSFMLIGLDAVDKYFMNADYFATYHPSEIEMARERRAGAGGNTDYMIISHQQHREKSTDRDLVNMIIPCEPPSGSSALLGVLAGIKLGYQKIIVCGCPLIGVNDKQYDYANFQKGWTAKFEEIKHKTRSMSGWTRELLGEPTEEWLIARSS